MSDPMVEVFGSYQDAAGRPMTGSVTFVPDIYAPDDTPGTALKSQQKVVARLDSDGFFLVQLTASDDDGWRTDGVSIPYRVDERIPGIDRQRLVFVLKPGPVDLNTQPDVPIDYDGPVEVPVPGPPGPANELTIGEVETLPPGSDATATITGTPPAQVLNLGIPEGEKGEDGEDGEDGGPGGGSVVIVAPEPPDPTDLPEGTQWVDTDSDVPPFEGSTGHTIQDEGTGLAARTGLNFVGPAVAATDDAANDRTLVTISSPNIIVLGAEDPVPGGTPAGTVIIRTT